MNPKLYLGLDYSTQQLKSLVYDEAGGKVAEVNIDYDREIDRFKTINGVYSFGNGVICSPSVMWIEATDILFQRLSRKVDMFKIVAISGSAQQHTSMFWNNGASEIVSNLDPKDSLISQLGHIFSKPLSPSWMDTSTTEEYKIFCELLGGAAVIENRIGSTLAKRFSSLQIMKAFSEDKDLDNNTETVSLVSNGMCSIFAGKMVGIDVSDSAGTGLQKCGSLKWDSELCSIISETLEKKLGQITPTNYVVGKVSNYFVEKYNMDPNCQVVSFTGDNPSSVVGMQLEEHDLCLSLGTSDTLFTSSTQHSIIPDIPTFVFPHPLFKETFISLLCYKNGSQVRNRLCQHYCGGNWAQFAHLIESAPVGNDGIFGMIFDSEEITPPSLPGSYFLRSSSGEILHENDLASSFVVRSLIEGQLLAKYNHYMAMKSGDMADAMSPISKLLVTGGGSANKSILQAASDIFGLPVYIVDTVNSATLGSVIRSVFGTESESFSKEFTTKISCLSKVCEPSNHKIYKQYYELFDEFSKMIKVI